MFYFFSGKLLITILITESETSSESDDSSDEEDHKDGDKNKFQTPDHVDEDDKKHLGERQNSTSYTLTDSPFHRDTIATTCIWNNMHFFS